MPVATPTSLGCTAVTMRLTIEANANEMPKPMITPEEMNCHGWAWATASMPNDTPQRTVPSMSVARNPTRLPSIPPSGPAISIVSALGSIRSPAWVVVMPKP
jgi:hypothetical protein